MADVVPAVRSDGSIDFDANAPLRVLKGSLLTATAGLVGGSMLGVWRAGSGTLLGVQMAKNSFLLAFPFFAVREYGVIPLLQTMQPSSSISSVSPPPIDAPAPYLARHLHNVPESALSAALVGGSVAAARRGIRGVPAGMIAFAGFATAAQLMGNETRRLVARVRAGKDGPRQLVPSDSTPSKSIVAQTPLVAPQPENEQPERMKIEEKRKGWLGKLASLSPIRKVDDAEYSAYLATRLGHVEQQLAEVDSELERVKGAEAGG